MKEDIKQTNLDTDEAVQAFIESLIKKILKEQGILQAFDQFLTIEEVSKILRVHTLTVRSLLKLNKIIAFKVQRRILIHRKSLEHYLQSVRLTEFKKGN
jgi:excisionase family DNA binding protein